MTNHSPNAYMTLALQLAARGRATVSPNPMVGCVIVKNEHIVGQGWHERVGGPHAEIVALQAAGEKAADATAYVTLEPCCHHGRTPPCTDALIRAGVKEIYAASLDPNPLVAGKGVAALRAAGIKVNIGLCATEATALNEIFFHYIKYKKPLVIAKWAMSLDGKMVTHQNDTRQISGHESTMHTHQTRQMVDAILIGAKTARLDNPELTARFHNEHNNKQPLRIILTGKEKLSIDLKIFATNAPAKTLLVATEENAAHYQQMDHIEIITAAKNQQGLIDLPELLTHLGNREITSLLVEGGAHVHQSFFQENLVNKIQVYLAPTIIGNLEKKLALGSMDINFLGKDIFINTHVGSQICSAE